MDSDFKEVYLLINPRLKHRVITLHVLVRNLISIIAAQIHLSASHLSYFTNNTFFMQDFTAVQDGERLPMLVNGKSFKIIVVRYPAIFRSCLKQLFLRFRISLFSF